MNNPELMTDCPVCKGKGNLIDNPCPFPRDVEPACESCDIVNCNVGFICDGCEGSGQMPERDASFLLRGSMKLERAEA